MPDPQWYDAIPDTITVEKDGAQVPLRDHPMVKESPDLGHFAKRTFDLRREVDSRVPLPKDNKPETMESWKKEYLPRLQKGGVVPTPLASPDDYDNVKPPADLPKSLHWSDDLSKELKTIAHKHQIPKEAMPELIELHKKSVLGAVPQLNVSFEEAMAGLKKEFGAEFEEREEMAKRFLPEIFSRPGDKEFMEQTGMGNHPVLLSIIMRLAPRIQADSSVIPEATKGGGKGTMTPDQARMELTEIATNPNHPKHNGYMSGSKEVMDYIDGLYKQAYPGDPVTVS
jgi:hypothetical protein